MRERTRVYSEDRANIEAGTFAKWLRLREAGKYGDTLEGEAFKGAVKFTFRIHGDVFQWQAVRQRGGNVEQISGVIRYEKVPCNYGGWRLFFLCPDTGARCLKLYFVCQAFRSMAAAGLHYKTESLSEERRLKRSLRRVEKVIGDDDHWYIKPKGMHQTTYSRYVAKHKAIDRRLAAIEAKRTGALFAHSLRLFGGSLGARLNALTS